MITHSRQEFSDTSIDGSLSVGNNQFASGGGYSDVPAPLERSTWEVWEEFGPTNGISVRRLELDVYEPLHIPKEFGYIPGPEDVAIHFTPEHLVLDGQGGTKYVAAIEPLEDQKYVSILSGLRGSLDYIEQVDAGLLPKPSNIVGITNQTMAIIAHRAGMRSVIGMAKEASQSPTLDESVFEFPEDIVRWDGKVFFIDWQEEAVVDVLSRLIQSAAVARRIGLSEVYDLAIQFANAIFLGFKRPAPSKIVVWSTYEDFRSGVMATDRKLGGRLVKFASRDLQLREKLRQDAESSNK